MRSIKDANLLKIQEIFRHDTLYNSLRIYFYYFQLHIFYSESAEKGGNSGLLLFQDQCSPKQCQKSTYSGVWF